MCSWLYKCLWCICVFSKDVSFFRWKINSVNYKKHSGRYSVQTLLESWTGTKEEKKKFIDATPRLSLGIFYADHPVYIFDFTLIRLIHFVPKSLDVMMLLRWLPTVLTVSTPERGWRTKNEVFVSTLGLSSWHSQWTLGTHLGFYFRSYKCIADCCHGNKQSLR